MTIASDKLHFCVTLWGLMHRHNVGDKKRTNWYLYGEVALHLAYWLFHFTSVNTSWSADWTDRAARNGVAQITIVLYPIIFYLNAFMLIPRFLKSNQWIRYAAVAFLITLTLEVLRSLVFVLVGSETDAFFTHFQQEFWSNDNLIFGLPNSLVFSFIFSTIYRFTRDWIVNQRVIASMQIEKLQMIKRMEELEQTMQRSKAFSPEDLTNELKQIFAQRDRSFKKAFQAKRREETYLLKTHDITYFKAQGDFVLAFDDQGNSFILNQTISVLHEALDPTQFFRINRSEIVNAAFLLKYSSHVKNRLAIHLKGVDDVLYTSNTKTPDFRLWLENAG